MCNEEEARTEGLKEAYRDMIDKLLKECIRLQIKLVERDTKIQKMQDYIGVKDMIDLEERIGVEENDE